MGYFNWGGGRFVHGRGPVWALLLYAATLKTLLQLLRTILLQKQSHFCEVLKSKLEILSLGSRSIDGAHKTQGISGLTEFWFPRSNFINLLLGYLTVGQTVKFLNPPL